MIRDTFIEIEKIEGVNYSYDGNSPLSNWYHGLRKIPISEFCVEDLCKCIRQNIYIAHIIIYVINVLKNNSLAGEIYDGELAVSLKTIDSAFWVNHIVEKNQIKEILLNSIEQFDEDVKSDIHEVLIKLA